MKIKRKKYKNKKYRISLIDEVYLMESGGDFLKHKYKKKRNKKR